MLSAENFTHYPNEFYDLVDEYVASGRYGGRPEAAEAVRRARPNFMLQARYPANWYRRWYCRAAVDRHGSGDRWRKMHPVRASLR